MIWWPSTWDVRPVAGNATSVHSAVCPSETVRLLHTQWITSYLRNCYSSIDCWWLGCCWWHSSASTAAFILLLRRHLSKKSRPLKMRQTNCEWHTATTSIGTEHAININFYIYHKYGKEGKWNCKAMSERHFRLNRRYWKTIWKVLAMYVRRDLTTNSNVRVPVLWVPMRAR